MSLLVLMLQGGLMGWVAGKAFNVGGDPSAEFWAVVAANTLCIVAYGVLNKFDL